jgi:hypothetical protein
MRSELAIHHWQREFKIPNIKPDSIRFMEEDFDNNTVEFHYPEVFHQESLGARLTYIKIEKPPTGIKAIPPSAEFTKGDKFIYYGKMVWSLGWFTIFVIVSSYNLIVEHMGDILGLESRYNFGYWYHNYYLGFHWWSI